MQNNKTHTETKKSHTQVRGQGTDIIQVLLEDHKPLKTLIKTMKDSRVPFKERQAVFEEFAVTLTAHTKPEENVLYKIMKGKEGLRELAFEGEVEHGLADQLVEEIKRTSDEDLCGARIKVLAELVEHHIEEEEDDLFPQFKKKSTSQERITFGNEFLRLKVNYLGEDDDGVYPDSKQVQMKSEAEVQEIEYTDEIENADEIEITKDWHH